MKVNYNNTQGKARKDFVKAIAGITEEDIKYCGVPTYAYDIGPSFKVTKDGTLFIDDETQSDVVENLLEELDKLGYTFDESEQTEEDEEKDNLIVQIRVDDFDEKAKENLNRLIQSKATLIKKTLETDHLDFEFEENILKFPWFKLNKEKGEANAYAQFCKGLVNLAHESKRIVAKEKEVENEKFAFRIFLIRLGMVGEEYKVARKILLNNLTGNAAFKNGGKSNDSK